MRKKISKYSFVVAMFLIAGLLLSACGQGETEKTNSMKMAYFTAMNLDPAFLSTIADENAARQMYDFLVYQDEDYNEDPKRSLAERWESNDAGTVWAFYLRNGVKFHDGKALTSRDVKFTFDRLRDPDIGAATVELYSNISEITTPDDLTVVFELSAPNPDFLKDLFDYHALVVDADNTDFATKWNGTGPFICERYVPEDRIVYKKNPNYWMVDDNGVQMPYLEGLEFIFMEDQTAQIDALRGGQVDYVMNVPSEYIAGLKKDSKINVYSKESNSTYIIRMRSDRGPAADNKVRQALKAGTDRKAILDGAAEGLGVTGRDTPIGPIFGDFYLDVPEPEVDVARAKRLLAEAGYPDGLDITLYAQQFMPIPQIAIIWKEQMAKIGVNVDIQQIPVAVYYTDDMWLEVDFAITDWGPRAYPQPLLDLGYVTGAKWNETHWHNEKHDILAALAAKEMNPEQRIRYYHEIQRVFIEDGSIIVPFFTENKYGLRSQVKGFKPHAGMAADLRLVYIE